MYEKYRQFRQFEEFLEVLLLFAFSTLSVDFAYIGWYYTEADSWATLIWRAANHKYNFFELNKQFEKLEKNKKLLDKQMTVWYYKWAVADNEDSQEKTNIEN